MVLDQLSTKATLDNTCYDRSKNDEVAPPRQTRKSLSSNGSLSTTSLTVSTMETVISNNNDISITADQVGTTANTEEKQEDGPYETKVTVVERRKYVDPKELAFLQSKFKTSLSTTNKALEEIASKPRTNPPVGKVIRKFGGPRKNLVERRKEQLDKKWSEPKAAVFIKKPKWDRCKVAGAYKKRIVVEKQYK